MVQVEPAGVEMKTDLFFDFFVFKLQVQVTGEGGILKDFALMEFFTYRRFSPAPVTCT
jgi:hypothetical protein